jgi:transcription elongation factor GreB
MAELEAQRSQVEANHSDEADRTHQLTIINGRLSALSQRLAGAKLVDLTGQPADQVRFGATVTLKIHSGQHAQTLRTFTIVGVDEASVDEGRLAFVAPIARALLGARPGQIVNLRMGLGEEKAEVIGITYDIPLEN